MDCKPALQPVMVRALSGGLRSTTRYHVVLPSGAHQELARPLWEDRAGHSQITVPCTGHELDCHL